MWFKKLEEIQGDKRNDRKVRLRMQSYQLNKNKFLQMLMWLCHNHKKLIFETFKRKVT